MILESVNVESEIQEATVESQEATVESIVPGEGSAPSVERRGPSQKDSSYYPPKSAKANRPSANRNSLRLAGLSPLDTDSDMPETQVSAGERNPSHSDKVKESLPDSASGNVSASTPAATCIAETEETSGFRTEPQCDIEQARQRPAGSATRAITSQIEDPGRLAPSTPVRDLGTVSSPRTEEIPREKIPTSLESTPSSPIRSVSRSPIEIDTVRELMLEAIPIIHSLSMHQRGLQPEVYKRILQTVKIYQDEASPIRTQWSDGSTWKRILRAGRSESKQVSMLNMLEYMGASAWYEDQIDLAQEMIRTKKNQPVDRKGATIYVLNRIQSEETVWGHGKCIKSVDGHRTGVVREVDKEERKHITMQLSRGKKLRTRLVKELSLGILFSSKIW